MSSLNKVTIIGHVGKDPEIKYLQNGDCLANISIATTEKWTDKASGEKKEQTEWHRVMFFGKLAEVVGRYIRKGSLIYVEGSLRTRKYTDKDGIEKYATDIRSDTMKMLGGKTDGASSSAGSSSNDYKNKDQSKNSSSSNIDLDDEIPF